MSRKFEEIESELLRLDRHTQAALAKSLLDSLDMLTDAEYDELWAEEGEARYARFLAGQTTAVDGAEVFARARSRRR